MTLGTKLGLVSVVGMKAGASSDQVIQGVVSALPSATWQSVTLVASLRGAHLGDVDGVGAGLLRQPDRVELESCGRSGSW